MAGSKKNKVISIGKRIKEWLYHFVYAIAWVLIWIASKVMFGLRVTRRAWLGASKGPVLVLSNHQSFIDPFLAVVACHGRSLRFVVGHYLFQNPKFGPILRWMESIPKTQFTADPGSVRKMLEALKQNRALLIYPEGQRSVDGGPSPLVPGILRLASKAGADVYTLRQNGAYSVWPRWRRKGLRPGFCELELDRFCSGEELKEKGHEAFEEKLREQLAVNEYEWLTGHPEKLHYGGDQLASNLNFLLHRCTSCDKPEAMEAVDQTLHCRFCGAQTEFGTDMMLRESKGNTQYNTIYARHRWQIEQERQDYENSRKADPVYIESEGRMETMDDYGNILLSEPGVLSLEEDEIIFRGEKERELRFSIHQRLSMFREGEYLQLVQEGETYRFFTNNPYSVIRLVDLLFAYYTEND